MMLRALIASIGLLASDHGDLSRLHSELLRATGANRELYAALVVLGGSETAFAERFERDGCFKWECDRGLAVGYFQAHQAGCPALFESAESRRSVRIMTACAARHMRYGFRVCGTWAGAFATYAGLPCGHELGRKREALMRRVVR